MSDASMFTTGHIILQTPMTQKDGWNTTDDFTITIPETKHSRELWTDIFLVSFNTTGSTDCMCYRHIIDPLRYHSVWRRWPNGNSDLFFRFDLHFSACVLCSWMVDLTLYSMRPPNHHAIAYDSLGGETNADTRRTKGRP